MDYQELLKAYQILLSERDQLVEENERLRRLVNLSNFDKVEMQSSVVTMQSSTKEKLSLFKDLFISRSDVYAKRWQSVASGKSGYQPVCENEWHETLCDKKKYKCSKCPNRKLKPIDDQVIFDHLSGKDMYARDVIGVYPLLEDDTCKFLAIDFDKSSYKNDVLAFFKVCKLYHVPAYIERSRSGNGAHVWLFFSEPVYAQKARKLGSLLFSIAMSNNSELSFESFDRFFPNQDYMPRGGFGNLIALPLQGLARKNGNSIFVDENFNPIADQWSYLCVVEKLSASQINQLINKIDKSLDIDGDVSEETGFHLPIGNQKEDINDFKGIKLVNIIKYNALYLLRSQLNPKLEYQLKKLASFKNPEFYQLQAMRFPIYNKPRVISLFDVDDKYLILPRGCKTDLLTMLTRYHIDYAIEDKRQEGEPIKVVFKGELREEQQMAALALLEYDMGVLSATTAFGKTVTACYLIAERKCNTLILVNKQALLEQWKQSLLKFLEFDYTEPETPRRRGRKIKWSPVGQLGGNRRNLHGIVDVATMQSLIANQNLEQVIERYGMVIVDECHHVPAVSFEAVLKTAPAKYIYGLTATPVRKDGHNPIIFMRCGAIRHRVSAIEAAQRRAFEHTVIPRFTFTKNDLFHSRTNFFEIYDYLVKNEFRNQLIVSDVTTQLAASRTPLILTERIEHIDILAEMLKGKCENIIVLKGSMSLKEKRLTMDRLSKMSSDEKFVLISTGRYIGEGFDLPRLDTLFIVLPISWKGRVSQYAGRLHREYQGKTEVIIYDYVDVHIPLLEKMYHKRLSSYKKLGYKVKMHDKTGEIESLLYNQKDYMDIFKRDIQLAQREVVVVSPYLSLKRTKTFSEVFKTLKNDINIIIITRPLDSYKTSEHNKLQRCIDIINSTNANIIFKAGFHQKYTIIDCEVVWYGSINFLGYGNSEESIMRLKSIDIATELLKESGIY